MPPKAPVPQDAPPEGPALPSSAWGHRAPTWYSDTPPVLPRIGLRGNALAILRGVPLIVVLLAGLGLTLVSRPVERLGSRTGRPVTGRITVIVCRLALLILGLRVRRRRGADGRRAGVIVANHASWLDIFVLNAGGPMYFISKAEVAGWAGIGWLARATGTVFIRRSRTEARAHVDEVAGRLAAGHGLTLFAEGTSSDGAQVLPFRPTLFEAILMAARTGTDLSVQPVAVRYHAPPGRDPRFYGWWGAMDFAPHARAVLSQWPQGTVDVDYGDPVPVTGDADRKRLAATLEAAVRAGFDASGRPRGAAR